MKVKFEMTKEVLEKAAISRGGWKLFWGGLGCLILSYMFTGGVMMAVLWISVGIDNVLPEVQAITNVIGFALTTFCFVCFIYRKRRFLEDYWRRNVVGYTYYVSLAKGFASLGVESWPVDQVIEYRFSDNIKFWKDDFRLIIGLSLGGLFRSRAVICWRDHYWSAKIIKRPPRDDFFLIRLYDNEGNSQTMTPESTLNLVADYIRNYGSWPQTLGHLIGGLENQCNRLTEEAAKREAFHARIQQNFQQQVADLENRIEGLSNLALETITAIAKTSRFKDSKEGKKIRRDLSARLRTVLPKYHVCLRDLDAIEAVKPSAKKAAV